MYVYGTCLFYVCCSDCVGMFVVLLFAFQSMFISIWVSRLEIAEFPDSAVSLLHKPDGIVEVR